MQDMEIEKKFGEDSWRLQSGAVEAWLTCTGGQLGPVRFRVGERYVEPLSVAPWYGDRTADGEPNILRILRGDFFCLPFGATDKPYNGVTFPPHGETSNAAWAWGGADRDDAGLTVTAEMDLRLCPGHVQKRLLLPDDHAAVYSSHIISGLDGRMSLGHHAMLKFPDEPESGLISTSPLMFGMTHPEGTEHPARGGYDSLQPNVVFESIERVPLARGGTTDLSRYPARSGFEDIVILATQHTKPFAWSAVSFPSEGYAWINLKDASVLPQTILWISNGGRHYSPWNGRHRGVMGVEEVANYFYGVDRAVTSNPFIEKGSKTYVELSAKHATTVATLMFCVPVSTGFGKVMQVEAEEKGVCVIGQSGESVRSPLQWWKLFD